MNIRNIIKTALIFSTVAGMAIPAISQESRNSLDLPPVIIEEKGSIKVRSGGKQDPNKTPRLSARELDSLNSLEKEKSFLLPTKHLPRQIVYQNFYNGFMKGQFGNFMTPRGDFGAGFKAGEQDEYDFYVNGGVEISDGHMDYADYESGYASLTNVYIAPEKFWIFGGSRTKSRAVYNQKNYYLYAVGDSSPARTRRNFDLYVDSDGYYSGVKFETGAGFRSMQLEQDESNPFNNAIYGYLNIKGDAGDFEVGGKAMLDLENVRGDGLYYTHVQGLMNYFVQDFSLELNLGYQLAENTMGDNRNSLLASAKMEYRLDKNFTARASVENNLERNSFKELANINPYVYLQSGVDYRTGQTFRGILYFHPSSRFIISAGINYGMYENDSYFSGLANGSFPVMYDKTARLGINAELDWQFTDDDLLTAGFIYRDDKIDSSSNSVPYSAPINVSASYHRMWFGFVGTQIGATYIDKRYADALNTIELDAYISLDAKVEVKLADNFTIFGNFENLLNSDVYIWEGYKERGLFLSGGVLWTFF